MALSPLPLRVATIDRDVRFLKALAQCLEPLDGTLFVHSGPVASGKLTDGRPHAVLVDIANLGPRWENWLIRHPLRVPQLATVICSELGAVEQRIRCLNLGVDDWIVKPCEPEEVVARVQAIVRGYRLRTIVEEFDALRGGELELRPDLFEAFAAGRPAGLTRREFEVLLRLALARGEVVERGRLYREVWGKELPTDSRSLDTVVRKIRGKLKAVSPKWVYVHTHRGVGHRFESVRARRVGATSVRVWRE
jgi:DNA-binding response OmpR family regulator